MLCVTVTGCTTVPNGEAAFDGSIIKGRVTGQNGNYTICFQLPKDVEGPVVVTVTSGTDRAKATGDVY